MKNEIIVLDNRTKKVILTKKYSTELEAQNDFDILSNGWSEWDDKRYSMDLVVTNKSGTHIRRSMYTDNYNL